MNIYLKEHCCVVQSSFTNIYTNYLAMVMVIYDCGDRFQLGKNGLKFELRVFINIRYCLWIDMLFRTG